MQSSHLVSVIDEPEARCCICGRIAKRLRAWNKGKVRLCYFPECARARKTQRQRIRRRHKKAQLMLPLFT